MNGMYRIGSYYLPFVTAEITEYETIDKKQIPTGELAIHRGIHVEAMDGYVGNVDEFVINPKTDRITHLVMREGHLWGKKDVIIPLSAMDRTHEDTVFLKLDKHQIEALPTFPLERHWS
jgi:sporulation protein YlmC with PRC-barrel domain